MDRNDISWGGYWVACPTPYREDGALDPDALHELLEFYADIGVHGALINGTTGEWFSQSEDERKIVAETAVKASAGRMTIVIGCTNYTAKQVIALGEHAMSVGADGILSSSPAYSRPFPDEIVAFYEDICEALPDAPMMIYNWPHGTNVELVAELADRLVEIDNVVSLKDSTPNDEQFWETLRTVIDRVRVFGQFMNTQGYDGMCKWGGDGTIGGGTLFGAPDPEFWEAHWRGDEETCLAHVERIDRLFPKLWYPGGWAGYYGHYQSQLKALMKMLGQPGGTVRPPRLPITDPDKLKALREILTEESLLPVGTEAPA